MFHPMLTSFCFVFNHFLRSRSREQASGRLDESSGLGRLHFSSCYFSQAFEDRHFTEREGFFRHEVRRSTRSGLMFKNAGLIGRLGEENASAVIRALEKEAGAEVEALRVS